MNTVLLWALIAVSDGYYNRGNVSVVAHFPSAEACEHVRQNIPVDSNAHAILRCIQGRYVFPK